MPKISTLTEAYEAVAQSLRDFGYPDVTATMVREAHAAMKQGERTLPHDIVGQFAQSQLEVVGDALDRLPDTQS